MEQPCTAGPFLVDAPVLGPEVHGEIKPPNQRLATAAATLSDLGSDRARLVVLPRAWAGAHPLSPPVNDRINYDSILP